MDIYVLIAVPSVSGWKLDTCEAKQKSKLEELGIEPIAYAWNKHITLEPRPFTNEISDFLSSEEDFSSWRCFALKGDFLSKIEEDVNQWVDEWCAEHTALEELLEQVYEAQNRSLFAFERNSETIDSIYADESANWIYEKVRKVMNRGQKLEGFVVKRGLA